MAKKEKTGVFNSKLNAISAEALAAIESKDAGRLAAAVATVAGAGIFSFFSESGKMAPHMLSTAIASGWVEGARILMPLDNQWSYQEINWATRRPLALGGAQGWDSTKMTFGEDILCGPLGVACISGQVECAKILLESQQDDKRRRVANFERSDFAGNLDFMIDCGAKKELAVYLDAMGPIALAHEVDKTSLLEAPRALIELASGPYANKHSDAVAGEMLRMLFAHGFKSLAQERLTEGDSSDSVWGWAEDLWGHAIAESCAGIVAALIDEGFPPQKLAYEKSPLCRAAESLDSRSAFAVDIVSRLLNAGALGESVRNREGVAFDAVAAAVKQSNWKIAGLLAEACPLEWSSEQKIRASEDNVGKQAALNALFEKSAKARSAGEQAAAKQEPCLGESLIKAEGRARDAEKKLEDSERTLARLEARVRCLEAIEPRSTDESTCQSAERDGAAEQSTEARERMARARALAPMTASEKRGPRR